MRLATLLALLAVSASAQTKVNADAKLVADFQARLQDYLKIHRDIKAKIPLKPTNALEKITANRDEFTARLREVRAGAKQGDIFAPPIAKEIRRLLAIAMQGQHARRVHQSLKHAEPVHLQLRVNDLYPKNLPLQSMPPTLLANLPALPPDIEYRLIAHDLILRDVDADLIIDFVPNAIL